MPELARDVNLTVNRGITKMKPSAIRAFDMEVSAIPGILKLTLGEPDFNTPEHVKAAAVAAIKNNDSHYSTTRGKLALRQAISKWIKRERGIDYSADDEIVVTIGATEALTATVLAMFNPGDKVIVPTPVFSLYFPIVELAGATPVLVDTSNDGFVLTADRLEEEINRAGDGVKAVMLNYPTNPTGRNYSEQQLRELATVIKKHHLMAIADEIYHTLTYDGVQPASLTTMIPERTVLIDGLSKSHAMTGYRLGFIAGPAAFIEQASKVHGFLVTTASDASQAAAIEAYNNGDADPIKYREAYQRRRDYLREELSKIGFEFAVPNGAFYMFVKIPQQYGKDDWQFGLDLAHQAKVGIIPGSAFGPGGEGYFRISYAASDEDLHEFIRRLTAFMNNLN
ncbi:MAG TPA: aminotransferase class I/II-fold pyridoxal phosphate-dependent enzyme [Candidatus Limosilactobacillus merdipullorum]|uniref:Aminotransferase n=1 Tax=Candidatus Limosilactobacillus merdipullorum TaxID=2838653 RepID=A0A9D1QMK6_9LACO|nr:aminotransferase class I/II-fold pyridoxal phosphate-dependent enzyme [Candidatus Limosilactobacillus merdipullorum]